MEQRLMELNKHLDLPFSKIITSYDRFFLAKQVLQFNVPDLIKGVCIISNHLFATISLHSQIKIWNLEGKKYIYELKDPLYGAKFVDRGIIGGRDGKLLTLNLQTQKEIMLTEIVDIGWIVLISNKIIINDSDNKLLIYSNKLE